MPICMCCHKTRLYSKFVTTGVCAKCKKLENIVCRKAVQSKCPICLELRDGTCHDCKARECNLKTQRPELVVKAFLETVKNFPAIVHNRTDPLTKTTCCSRRVDLRMDFVYFQVLVEIDEDQHRRYGEACELVRLLEIVNASGGIPTVLFRYNPDHFRRCGVSAVVAKTVRLALLKERIEFRVAVLQRRIRNDRSYTKSIILPILYVEYLFFDTSAALGGDVAIRSYQHDSGIARAILKCV